ncbi:hypothetical protein DFO67_12441 [Modicisalibacter xianhensis]|uniref:Uncharacterized protein n=1 Tax=Modicisalibacter xianhensis TaxID=442341 RepID=A0A4R8FD44_9GAMM|nr:hypothetical protein DFO67_12441 [Halomonas xianhensis]
MGLNNAQSIHTIPGRAADDPFCPPSGWEGDAEAYWEFLKTRWKDVKWGQRLRFAVSFARGNPVSIGGPYAATAARLLEHFVGLRGATANIRFV